MMDLALPRINGIEAARRIRETVPGTGVIILSAHDRAEYMKEFLKEDSAGKAYLLKESLNSTRDLVRTIQDVAVGRTVLDPVMVSKLTSSPNVQINSSLKGLTSRELQVLSHMAQANSNRSIAEALYIQPRTVEHHISSILAKLGFNANGELHGRVHAVLTYLAQRDSCRSNGTTLLLRKANRRSPLRYFITGLSSGSGNTEDQ